MTGHLNECIFHVSVRGTVSNYRNLAAKSEACNLIKTESPFHQQMLSGSNITKT